MKYWLLAAAEGVAWTFAAVALIATVTALLGSEGTVGALVRLTAAGLTAAAAAWLRGAVKNLERERRGQPPP